MRKILFVTALFLGMSTMLFAQHQAKGENKTPEQRAEFMTAALNKQLSLSEDQKAKIYAINLDRAKRFETLKADKQAKDKQSEARASFKKDDEQILAILNDAQKKTYQELKAKAHAKGRHHKGKKPAEAQQKA